MIDAAIYATGVIVWLALAALTALFLVVRLRHEHALTAATQQKFADVDRLARQARETRTERVWSNVPATDDEHAEHLGAA